MAYQRCLGSRAVIVHILHDGSTNATTSGGQADRVATDASASGFLIPFQGPGPEFGRSWYYAAASSKPSTESLVKLTCSGEYTIA